MSLNGIGSRIGSPWFSTRSQRGNTSLFIQSQLLAGGDSIAYALFDDYFFETPSGTTGQIKFYNGSAFVAKPVKVWNGSSWVVKPLKRYNGSTWVVTNY